MTEAFPQLVFPLCLTGVEWVKRAHMCSHMGSVLIMPSPPQVSHGSVECCKWPIGCLFVFRLRVEGTQKEPLAQCVWAFVETRSEVAESPVDAVGGGVPEMAFAEA